MVVIIFKVDIDNLDRRNAVGLEPITVNLYEGRLATTANTGYYLNQILVLKSNKLMKVCSAFFSSVLNLASSNAKIHILRTNRP